MSARKRNPDYDYTAQVDDKWTRGIMLRLHGGDYERFLSVRHHMELETKLPVSMSAAVRRLVREDFSRRGLKLSTSPKGKKTDAPAE